MVDSYDIRKPFGPQSFIVQSLYGFTGDVTFNVKPLNGTNGKKYYVSRLLYHNLSYLEEVGFNPYEGTDPAKKKQVIEVTLPTAVATSGIAVLSATINSQDVNVVIPGGLTEQGVLKFPVDFAVTALGDTVSKQKDSLLARQIVVNGKLMLRPLRYLRWILLKQNYSVVATALCILTTERLLLPIYTVLLMLVIHICGVRCSF